MPLDIAGWELDIVYSCSQKGLGAPSGVAPIVFAPAALARRVRCRSFAFDLTLLEDYWLRRKYHHTMCASLIYALREALVGVEEEGLTARWSRHHEHHNALVTGLEPLGLSLLPPPSERLWTLNAVRVPSGVDEAAVRKHLLERFNIEIGAGLGPLVGKIWRVGLMGASSTPALVTLFLSAIEDALAVQTAKASAT
jgi:alanine-glyoxylate transaminase / serine-glyoxylate transaminase / serine-pyruvate transaminase